MPAAAPVRGRIVREGAHGATAPAGGFVAAGPRPAQSEAFAGYRRQRVVVEHRLARLVQLGIRQARYFGRAKTRFQLYLAATVANLTLVAGKEGSTGDIGSAAIGGRAACADTGIAAANFGTIRLAQIWPLALLTPAFLPIALFSTKAFHPHF